MLWRAISAAARKIPITTIWTITDLTVSWRRSWTACGIRVAVVHGEICVKDTGFPL